MEVLNRVDVKPMLVLDDNLFVRDFKWKDALGDGVAARTLHVLHCACAC